MASYSKIFEIFEMIEHETETDRSQPETGRKTYSRHTDYRQRYIQNPDRKQADKQTYTDRETYTTDRQKTERHTEIQTDMHRERQRIIQKTDRHIQRQTEIQRKEAYTCRQHIERQTANIQ